MTDRPVNTAKKYDVKVVDLSDGCMSPVVVCGMVIGSDDKELVIGASVVINGTNKGVVTNAGGQSALKLLPDTPLIISLIGYENQKVYIGLFLHSDNNIIALEEDRGAMLNDAVATATLPTCKDENRGNKNDVNGHRTDKPKSHKKRDRRKCK